MIDREPPPQHLPPGGRLALCPEQREAVADLVRLRLGPGIVTLCGALGIDGGRLETAVLDEICAQRRF